MAERLAGVMLSRSMISIVQRMYADRGEGEYGNVYVTILQAVLTLHALFNQRDLRQSLAHVFSRVVRIGVAERLPARRETGSGLRALTPYVRSGIQRSGQPASLTWTIANHAVKF